MLTAGSDSVSESDDSDMTADISAEDIYAQTGKKRRRILPAWMKIMRRRHLQMTVSGDCHGQQYRRKHGSGRSQSDQRADPLRNKEILMEVINSTNISDSEKQDAIDEMVSMTDAAEKELAAETLLSAQGFEDVVVSISDSGADVVVSSTQVSDAKRAQIEDIETKNRIEAANITITPVQAAE